MRNKAYKIRLPQTSIQPTLNHLIKEGYVKRIGLSASYQLTHTGWNVTSAIRHDFLMLVVTHFAFPSLVAFLTTMITNHFTEIVSWLSKLLQFRWWCRRSAAGRIHIAFQQSFLSFVLLQIISYVFKSRISILIAVVAIAVAIVIGMRWYTGRGSLPSDFYKCPF